MPEPWHGYADRVKRWTRRAAAGVAVATLVGLVCLAPAHAQPDVTQMQPRDCLDIGATPDADIPQAWHLERLNMNAAWTMATGAGVTVAVIDTGVASEGTPFFSADRITNYDVLSGMDRQDRERGGMDCIHGTQVAGLLAAGRAASGPVDLRTNFSGIAPEATVIAYRVLSTSNANPDDEEFDTVDATIVALRHAVGEGVDVINLSQMVSGSEPRLPELRAAVQEAIDAGVVVVAAAGNLVEGEPPGPAYPASFEGVISVGMTTRSDAASPASLPAPDGAPGVAVSAPGSGIMSLNPSRPRDQAAYTNQAYAIEIEGTSFAAPIVAGVAALLLEVEPDLTPAQVKTRLIETADPPANTAPGRRDGFGIVNPVRALAGVPLPQETGEPVLEEIPAQPLPEPERRDMAPIYAGIGIGAAALFLVGMGLVISITVPAARRRTRGE